MDAIQDVDARDKKLGNIGVEVVMSKSCVQLRQVSITLLGDRLECFTCWSVIRSTWYPHLAGEPDEQHHLVLEPKDLCNQGLVSQISCQPKWRRPLSCMCLRRSLVVT